MLCYDLCLLSFKLSAACCSMTLLNCIGSKLQVSFNVDSKFSSSFVAAGSFLILIKDWEIISRPLLQSCTGNNFFLKINKEQSANLRISNAHISQVAGKNKCSFNSMITDLSEVSSVVCLLLSFVLKNFL